MTRQFVPPSFDRQAAHDSAEATAPRPRIPGRQTLVEAEAWRWHSGGLDDAVAHAGAGQPLPAEVQHRMEDELGVSLANVRVHIDDVAVRAARAVAARAFTVGENIFFGSGAYAPGTPEGDKLIAHELAHVVQAYEGQTRAPTGSLEVSRPEDTLERDAESVASRIAASPKPRRAARSQLRTYAPIRSGTLLRVADRSADGIAVLDSVITHLIEFWEREKQLEPSRATDYDANIERLRARSRPTPRQSEREMQEIYRWVGGDGERSYKHGHTAKRGGPGAKGATKPDINVSVAMIEVKNYDVKSPSSVTNLVKELRRQIEARREMGPYNLRHQSVIVDVRGQRVTPALLDDLRKRIAQHTGLGEEHIQFACWSSDVDAAPAPAPLPRAGRPPPAPPPRAALPAKAEPAVPTSSAGPAPAAGADRVSQTLRRFGRVLETLFSAKVQVPLALAGALLQVLEAMNMAMGALNGEGFVLKDEIAHGRQIEDAAKTLLLWYSDQHAELENAVGELTMRMVWNGSKDDRNAMRTHAGELRGPLGAHRTSVQDLRSTVSVAQDEAARKSKLARSLIDSRELAILTASMGTTVQTTLLGAMTDLSAIAGALSSACAALDKLDALIERDIVMLETYR